MPGFAQWCQMLVPADGPIHTACVSHTVMHGLSVWQSKSMLPFTFEYVYLLLIQPDLIFRKLLHPFWRIYQQSWQWWIQPRHLVSRICFLPAEPLHSCLKHPLQIWKNREYVGLTRDDTERMACNNSLRNCSMFTLIHHKNVLNTVVEYIFQQDEVVF